MIFGTDRTKGTSDRTRRWVVLEAIEQDWRLHLGLGAAHTRISAALHVIRVGVIDEPVPDRLAELLRELDEYLDAPNVLPREWLERATFPAKARREQ